MKIIIGELDLMFIVNYVIGVFMLGIGLMWDSIAGVQIQHSNGFGMLQIIWVSFWAMYILFNYYYQLHYGR